MNRSDELKQERAAVETNIMALHNKLKSEKRSKMTTDEETQWGKMSDELVSYTKSIQLAERTEAIERSNAANHIQDAEPKTGPSLEEQKSKVRSALGAYLRGGENNLTTEERSILAASNLVSSIQNRDVQNSTTGNLGAQLVKKEYMNEFEKMLLANNGVMTSARIIPTTTGGDLPWPTVDDTAAMGELLGEGVATAEKAIATGSFTLKAYKYSSKAILIPVELLQDDGYGLESEVPGLAAERIGRISQLHMTTGDGSGKPEGITVGASNSGTTLTANTISRGKLIDLIHSVNSAYRMGGQFMFNDATLKAIVKLSIGSADDRPLWVPSMRDGSPSTIEGYGYVINDHMPALATSANRALLFGALNKYYVRMVKDFNILRTDQRHIEKFVVGYYGYSRLDGRIANANAIKYAAVA